jgi:hypothetical protein
VGVGSERNIKHHPTYVHRHLMDGDLPQSIDHMRNAVSTRHRQWEMSGPEITATIIAKMSTYWDMQNMEEDKVRLHQEKRLHVLAKATPSYPWPDQLCCIHTSNTTSYSATAHPCAHRTPLHPLLGKPLMLP